MFTSISQLSKFEAKQLNPLVLAYIGDSIFDLYIRTHLVVNNRDMKVNKLNLKAISYVKANSQYKISKKLVDIFDEEELTIFKRGRNSKSGTVPKNADLLEYKAATGFEALLGFLYITSQKERLNYILDLVITMTWDERGTHPNDNILGKVKNSES
jgi:ribonuclease III family protein